MKNFILKIHPKDNVLVALRDLKKGEIVFFQDEKYTLIEDIPIKHKFFVHDMQAGDSAIMYGVLVGKAQRFIPAGSLMTTDNLKHAAEPYQYRESHYHWNAPDITEFKNRTFNGYHRTDGSVGTANYWLFIPTVFCENRNLDIIKNALEETLGYAVSDKYKNFTQHLKQAYQNNEDLDKVIFNNISSPSVNKLFKNVDGIKFLNHQGGCGGTRQDAAVLGKLLAAYANHPNVGGITVISLGCQNLQLDELLKNIKSYTQNFEKPLFVFEQQQLGNENVLVTEAIRATFKGLLQINEIERKPAPLSKLTLGVKCGGSDGFSGISANPAVGYCADLLVALGGKVLLAEFPELCGVEQELIDRMTNEDIAQKFIHLMKTYSNAALQSGSGFHMNPSPGNIKDGLITDAIKSAGAAKKGGTSPIVDVLDYTEQAVKPGLNLVCTPGNDVEATTGKVASGANLILFTTGLGTPTGNPVCPIIKVSSNSTLFEKMKDIIDINTGPVIEGILTIEEMGKQILEYCISAASGEIIPKAVLLKQDDFIPWKRGVSL